MHPVIGGAPAMAAHVLMIDDDARLTAMVRDYLQSSGYQVSLAPDLAKGRAALQREGFDALILDLMLPDGDGLDLTRELRADPRLRSLPLLMLTARCEPMDRILGLELGADDYLPKPFEPRELVARLQTILRRRVARPMAAEAAQRLTFDGLVIDLERRQVLRQGEAVELTGTEFELLTMLAREPQKVFSRDEILNRLRGHEADLYTRAVDIVVSRLRRKLEPLDCIKTLRNAGYTFAGARS
jgi:OmpR family response regulator RpaB